MWVPSRLGQAGTSSFLKLIWIPSCPSSDWISKLDPEHSVLLSTPAKWESRPMLEIQGLGPLCEPAHPRLSEPTHSPTVEPSTGGPAFCPPRSSKLSAKQIPLQGPAFNTTGGGNNEKEVLTGNGGEREEGRRKIPKENK